jgi:hypothetical protein
MRPGFSVCAWRVFISLCFTRLAKSRQQRAYKLALKEKENHVLWVLRTILIELALRNNVMEIAFGNHKNGTRTLDNHTTMSDSQVAQIA